MDGNRFGSKRLKSASLFLVMSFPLLLASGCATMRHHPSDSPATPSAGGAVGQVIRDASPQSPAARPIAPGTYAVNEEVQGRKLKVNRFDYPVIVNPAVEHWLTYFQGKGRKYFEKYLERSRYFIPEIARVLKSHKMPQDLVYLAMIESGFNNSAKSRARAVGPWQFIRQTGMRYGLKVDYWLDERRETRKATLAAIAYLKELYQEFGSWELSAAAYNAGENKVRRAIAKYHTNDFWEISRHKFFKRETRDYVPKIMAAAILTKNPELFAFENPFRRDKSPVANPTVMLVADNEQTQVTDNAEPTPKELGEEALKGDDTPDDPADKTVAMNDEEDDDEDGDSPAAISSSSPNPAMSPSVYMVANPNEHIMEFEVKGPADLFAISKAAGLPYSTMKMLNPELLRWCTPPYLKTYRVKLPVSAKERFLATYNDQSFDRRVVFMKYTVRRGDNIKKVAKHFGTEADPIRELNQMPSGASNLRVGSSIVLPVPTGYKRVIASMYDDKPFPPSRRHRRHRRRRHRRGDSSSASHHYRLQPRFARNGADEG